MDNIPPENSKKLGCFGKGLIVLAVFAIIILIGILFAYGYYNSQINKFIETDSKKISLTIEPGMGVVEISELLHEKKLISSPYILQAYMFINRGKVLQAGFYQIDTAELNLVKLVEELQKGSFEHKLTFREGDRVEQYVEYLGKEMGDEFADKFASSSYIKEGYMFPDTYIIENDYAPESLASWMRNTFDKKMPRQTLESVGLRGLSVEQVVILASIVEKEVSIAKDRPVVAGILVKRLQSGWPLQADATLHYAKGTKEDWWPTVTRDDYQNLNSPYNTYTNKGLPPGPIGNPSLSALKSVVEYQETDYWYYISGRDGTTHFAVDYDTHLQNIEKYLR